METVNDEFEYRMDHLHIVFAQVICNINKYLDVDRLDAEITKNLLAQKQSEVTQLKNQIEEIKGENKAEIEELIIQRDQLPEEEKRNQRDRSMLANMASRIEHYRTEEHQEDTVEPVGPFKTDSAFSHRFKEDDLSQGPSLFDAAKAQFEQQNSENLEAQDQYIQEDEVENSLEQEQSNPVDELLVEMKEADKKAQKVINNTIRDRKRTEAQKKLDDEAIRRKEIEDIAAQRIAERKLLAQELKLRDTAQRAIDIAVKGKNDSPGQSYGEDSMNLELDAQQRKEERKLLKQEQRLKATAQKVKDIADKSINISPEQTLHALDDIEIPPKASEHKLVNSAVKKFQQRNYSVDAANDPAIRARVINVPNGKLTFSARTDPIAYVPHISGQIPQVVEEIKAEFEANVENEEKFTIEEIGNVLQTAAFSVSFELDSQDQERYEQMVNTNYKGDIDYNEFVQSVKEWERDILLSNFIQSQIQNYETFKGKSESIDK